jgi:AraC-like DNA-binding protein
LSADRPYVRQAVTQRFPEKMKQLFLEFKRLPEGGNYLRFLGMLYELFGQLGAAAADNQGKSSHPTPWLKQSIDFMNMHYMEGITVQHVADYVNLHRSYFSTVFTEQCSVTPTQYLQQLRMKSAGTMLGESNFTVTEIALSLGYPDLYTFTKAFRKYYGQSPSQYRKGT